MHRYSDYGRSCEYIVANEPTSLAEPLRGRGANTRSRLTVHFACSICLRVLTAVLSRRFIVPSQRPCFPLLTAPINEEEWAAEGRQWQQSGRGVFIMIFMLVNAVRILSGCELFWTGGAGWAVSRSRSSGLDKHPSKAESSRQRSILTEGKQPHRSFPLPLPLLFYGRSKVAELARCSGPVLLVQLSGIRRKAAR